MPEVQADQGTARQRVVDRRLLPEEVGRQDEPARAADPGIGPRLVAEIRERGVITRLLRGVALQISPPFVITEAEITRIAEVFAAALDAAAARRGNAAS